MPISKIKAGGINDDAVTTAKIVDGTVAAVDIADGAVTSAKITYPLTTFSSTGIDDNATSTSIILTSSNDVAFGNTSANLVSNTSTQGGGGYVASDEHFEFATSSNRAAVEIGKNNANDGQLVAFRKQGTTIGSIGTRDTGALEIGSGDVYLQFNGNNDWIKPVDGSGNNKSGVDLGTSGARFDNLYLSGGVYVGGTASANYLEDYEEGTWTPTLLGASSNPTVTYVKQEGYYTKIGNSISLFCRVQTTARSGGSGTALIGGLPYAHNSARAGGGVGYISGVTFNSGYAQFGLSGDAGSSTIRYVQSGDGLGSNIINVTAVASSSNHDIVFTYTYQTNA